MHNQECKSAAVQGSAGCTRLPLPGHGARACSRSRPVATSTYSWPASGEATSMFAAAELPASAPHWMAQAPVLIALLQLLGLLCFAYIAARRVAPLMRAERDQRLDRPWLRLQTLLKFWFGQWKHPRYRVAGTLHLLIFAGFLILATRAFHLLIFGLSNDFVAAGTIGRAYDIIADYFATIVFLAVTAAAMRRIFYRPARYAVPAKFGVKGHPVDAIFLLALIALL